MRDPGINERLQRALAEKDWPVLDALAWEILCRWPEYVEASPAVEGWDFGLLTRSFLWDKVGRAIRAAVDSEGAQRERGLIAHPRPTAPRPTRSLQDKVCQRIRRILQQQRTDHPGRKRIYIPAPNERLEAAARALSTLPDTVLLAPVRHRHLLPSATTPPAPGDVTPLPDGTEERVLQSIVEGLAAQGLLLLPEDRETLAGEIAAQVAHLPEAEAAIRAAAPDLVVVHADNHPQLQHFVFAAKRHNIPTLLLQHGLDCEHYYLDDIYSDHVAAWGPERIERYRNDSAFKPRSMAVTGNPSWDHLPRTDRVTRRDVWVWATRPHAPEKCLSPSRRPDEGVEILDAILAALAAFPDRQLQIKCHPYDVRRLYEERLAENPLAPRVSFSEAPLDKLLRTARLAISEDSTAAVEALFAGALLVHAHLAPSTPVLPLVEMGAALPGFSAPELTASLRKLEALNPDTLARLRVGQRVFCEAFAGPDDGRACTRLRSYVMKILEGVQP